MELGGWSASPVSAASTPGAGEMGRLHPRSAQTGNRGSGDGMVWPDGSHAGARSALPSALSPDQPPPPRSELPSGICIRGAQSCLGCWAVLTNWSLRALLWCLLLETLCQSACVCDIIKVPERSYPPCWHPAEGKAR